ncbi:hypothetical protein TrRE_jg8985 [Triparma retinervis]|uniref:Uncharacterized protein n=1 Tax=Triparma retinervis TaxID=2557542 RepID=A0A9W7A2P9_9STRA|nr:hypothetical protein TrRE_jg8985 [Triparma retinervis]
MFRPSRGKGHWLRSYAKCKRNAEGYLVKNPEGVVRLRSGTYWEDAKYDQPAGFKGNSTGLLYMPEFEDRRDVQNDFTDEKDGNSKGNDDDADDDDDADANAVENIKGGEEDKKGTNEEGQQPGGNGNVLVRRMAQGFQELLGSQPDGSIAANSLANLVEASLWLVRMEEGGGLESEGEAKVRAFAKGFDQWEDGVEGWIWVMKGVQNVGVEIGKDELKAGYKIMLRQGKSGSDMNDGGIGLSNEELEDVIAWLAWESECKGGGVKGSMLRDVVQIFGRPEEESKAIKMVMRDASLIEAELKARGEGILKFYDGGKSRQRADSESVASFGPSTTAAAKSPTRSPARSMNLSARRSLVTHESFVSVSTKPHRGIKNQLHKTREDHRKDDLYDRVMTKLVDESFVKIPEGADDSQWDGGGMKSFMSKLGMDEGVMGKEETEKEKRRRKKEEKKERRRKKKEEKARKGGDEEGGGGGEGMKVQDVSEIKQTEEEEEEESTTKKKVPTTPKILTVMSHSHAGAFQKLHVQKKEVTDMVRLETVEREIGRRVVEEEDKRQLEEEMAEWAQGRNGGYEAPVLHQTKEYQEKLTQRLNVPLERNKYKGPPPVKEGQENMMGRQRPNPEIPTVPLKRFSKKMTQKEWDGWKRVQDEKVLRNKLIKKKILDEETEAKLTKYSVSDASRAMLRPEMEPNEGYGKGAIFEELYKEGVQYVVDKKHDKPSSFLHRPTKHLENDVTQEILMARKNIKRNAEYYSRPKEEVEPEEPTFQPDLPEKSKEIVNNDPRYTVPYDVREGRRVEKWVEERKVLANKEKEKRSGLEGYVGNNARRGSVLKLSFPIGPMG